MNIADKKTLITIVVPVYNVEKYLQQDKKDLLLFYA